jgi:4-diphosphocytidyl-2-C-methyl-D-erythritol kinase
MKFIQVPAFAKVNLRLDVLGRRADGYHELRTIFQALTLHDTVKLTLADDKGGAVIQLKILGDAALADEPVEKNLVWRAVDALRSEWRLKDRFVIELEKNVPVGRGLGGGSSDAAAAMVALLRLTGRRIRLERLLELASGLGADVPFFLLGGRALATSRGDEIYPLPDLPRRAVLVVSPRGIAVSTRDAYQWVDERLTTAPTVSKLWGFCALCWSKQGDSLSNDFEAAVFKRHARLGKLKRLLLKQGAAEAALAGSGSAVFGIFRNPAQARRAAKQFPEDQVFLCTTISRTAYTRALWGRAGRAELPADAGRGERIRG